MNDVVFAEAQSPLPDEVRQNILVQAGVFARDPSAFPGLSVQMDPSSGLDKTFRPVAYDTRKTTGVMVHCSICPQHQKHFDGAIVRLVDGKLGLVGNDCGKRHFFGEDGWTAITKRIQLASDHALFLARFGTAKERLDSIDAILCQWIVALRSVSDVRAQFKGQLAQLFVAIRREARSGELCIDQEQQVPFRRSNGEIEMRTEIRRIPVCRIEPLWFFGDDDLAEEVERERLRLVQAGGFLHADAKPHNVAAVRTMIRNCRRAFETIAGKQRQLSTFSAASSSTKIAEWGNHVLAGKSAFIARQKVIERRQGGILVGFVDLGNLLTDTKDWDKIRELWPSL